MPNRRHAPAFDSLESRSLLSPVGPSRLPIAPVPPPPAAAIPPDDAPEAPVSLGNIYNDDGTLFGVIHLDGNVAEQPDADGNVATVANTPWDQYGPIVADDEAMILADAPPTEAQVFEDPFAQGKA